LCAWCWAVLGNRSKVDINSVRDSESHTLSTEQGWAATAFLNGRNKLEGRKKGSRPWNAYFVCLCPNGVHQPIPEGHEWNFTKSGNPKKSDDDEKLEEAGPDYCTTCPLNAIDFKLRRCGEEPMQLFSNWFKSCGYGVNIGKLAKTAIEWLELQGVTAGEGNEFDTNGGRKALAGWLGELKVPYHEGFEIHADLFTVWSESYQGNVTNANGFARRTQSTDPYVATAALRRLAHHFGCSRKNNVENLDMSAKLMVAFLESQGQSDLARKVLGN
jgi:hypothetical protein